MNCPSCNITLLISDRQGIKIVTAPNAMASGWIEANWTKSSNGPFQPNHAGTNISTMMTSEKNIKTKSTPSAKNHFWMIYSTLDNALFLMEIYLDK